MTTKAHVLRAAVYNDVQDGKDPNNLEHFKHLEHLADGEPHALGKPLTSLADPPASRNTTLIVTMKMTIMMMMALTNGTGGG